MHFVKVFLSSHTLSFIATLELEELLPESFFPNCTVLNMLTMEISGPDTLPCLTTSLSPRRPWVTSNKSETPALIPLPVRSHTEPSQLKTYPPCPNSIFFPVCFSIWPNTLSQPIAYLAPSRSAVTRAQSWSVPPSVTEADPAPGIQSLPVSQKVLPNQEHRRFALNRDTGGLL